MADIEYLRLIAQKRGIQIPEIPALPPIRKPLPKQPVSSSDSDTSPIVLKVAQLNVEGNVVDIISIDGLRYAYKKGTQNYLGIIKMKRQDGALVPTIVKDRKYPDPLEEYEVDSE